jgi:hypothetical protein
MTGAARLALQMAADASEGELLDLRTAQEYGAATLTHGLPCRSDKRKRPQLSPGPRLRLRRLLGAWQQTDRPIALGHQCSVALPFTIPFPP